ncbi:unnamed protein product, partial [Iphiclides podalirius]
MIGTTAQARGYTRYPKYVREDEDLGRLPQESVQSTELFLGAMAGGTSSLPTSPAGGITSFAIMFSSLLLDNNSLNWWFPFLFHLAYVVLSPQARGYTRYPKYVREDEDLGRLPQESVQSTELFLGAMAGGTSSLPTSPAGGITSFAIMFSSLLLDNNSLNWWFPFLFHLAYVVLSRARSR